MSIIFFFSTSELLVTLKKGERPSCVACKLYECREQNCNPSLCDDRYFTNSCRRNQSAYKTHSLITKRGPSRGGECLKSHSSTKNLCVLPRSHPHLCILCHVPSHLSSGCMTAWLRACWMSPAGSAGTGRWPNARACSHCGKGMGNLDSALLMREAPCVGQAGWWPELPQSACPMTIKFCYAF